MSDTFSVGPETIPFGKRAKVPELKQVDPAPHPLDVHHDKLTALVNNLGLTTLDAYRNLRDEIDELMRSTIERHDDVCGQIEKLRDDNRSGLDTVTIIREALTKLREQHRVALPRVANIKPNGDAQ